MVVKHGAICNPFTKGDVVVTIYLRNGGSMDLNGISDPSKPGSPQKWPADKDAPHVPVAAPDFDPAVALSEEEQPWLVCGRCNAPAL